MPLKWVRASGLVGLFLAASAPAASGATQREIDQAIQDGTKAIKAKYTKGVGLDGGRGGEHGIGPACLSGLALLEAGVPATDEAVKAITKQVREAAYTQHRTYQISLCLMYLDRLNEPADEPLIQALAVRLLVGQNARTGGWGYDCVLDVPAEDVKAIRAIKFDTQSAGKFHPELAKYGQALAARNKPPAAGDDNSNTQFALLAVWMARKHGVPVDDSLKLIEARFMAAQDQRTGNWSYNGAPGSNGEIHPGSPAMYCAGLLGMSTAVARREERRLKAEPPGGKKPDKPAKDEPKPTDPFAPAAPAAKEPAKAPPKKPARPADKYDLVVQRAFAGLGLTLAEMVRNGKGFLANTGHGYGDMYFLWSMERVGVVYGAEQIGGLDWYDLGSTAIVRSQSPDGSWTVGGYNAEVNTAFAVLFLAKSNLARDLSSKVQRDPTNTEMRAGKTPSPVDVIPTRPAEPVAVKPPAPVLTLPNPSGDKSIAMAADLLKSSGDEWKKLLASLRDAKGSEYTRALLAATAALEPGDRKQAARDALAERLCRMTPDTLRAMLKSEDAELRRAASLACAMKDDKGHIPDLIAVLTDADDSVTRAAHAGLKSLTGQDFGPAAGVGAGQKALAATAWKDWYAKSGK